MTLLAALLALQDPNLLTPAEAEAGWRLLFDGKTTEGWRNYRAETVGSGWQVVDGELTIVEPGKAGDIVTKDKYAWFELVLEAKLGKGQNSGVMFHVTEDGLASWHSGPEVQLYDHAIEEGVETTGFLYQLYKPTFDASKPAGEWNHLRIRVARDLCWTELNGKRLYEYQLGSKEFWAKVGESKFSKYPGFARAGSGHIALQGDHGRVSFRGIKLRLLE
jgi:hypothetical protein